MSGTLSSIRHTLKHSGGGRRLGTHHLQLTGRATLSSSPVHKAAGTAIAASTRSKQHLQSRGLFTGPPNTQVGQFDPESRTAINTERYEYSHSDSTVAAQQSTWDPAYLTPEMVREASRLEAMRDGLGLESPLEVSPANQEISMSTNETGRGEWMEKGASRRVSPPKAKKLDYGGGAVATYGTCVG